MKKIYFIVFLVISLFLSSVPVIGLSEDIPVSIIVNGKFLYTDSAPFIEGGRTYVPLRFVAEAFGIETIDWDGEHQVVYIKHEGKKIFLGIDRKIAVVDRQLFTLEKPAKLVNGRTMVPLRFIAETFDCKIEWDALTYSVVLTKENLVVPTASIANINYTREDILWLAKIVTVEARNLSYEGKLAVANVVNNRKKSTAFPNSIYDVIFQIDYHVQFPPAHKSGFKESTPTLDSILAAKMALNGVNNIDRCLFFNNRPFRSKANDLYKVIEGEYFYY